MTTYLTVLQNFRDHNEVEALGNLFNGLSFEDVEPIIIGAFGINSEEYEYLCSFFNRATSDS